MSFLIDDPSTPDAIWYADKRRWDNADVGLEAYFAKAAEAKPLEESECSLCGSLMFGSGDGICASCYVRWNPEPRYSHWRADEW